MGSIWELECSVSFWTICMQYVSENSKCPLVHTHKHVWPQMGTQHCVKILLHVSSFSDLWRSEITPLLYFLISASSLPPHSATSANYLPSESFISLMIREFPTANNRPHVPHRLSEKTPVCPWAVESFPSPLPNLLYHAFSFYQTPASPCLLNCQQACAHSDTLKQTSLSPVLAVFPAPSKFLLSFMIKLLKKVVHTHSLQIGPSVGNAPSLILLYT